MLAKKTDKPAIFIFLLELKRNSRVNLKHDYTTLFSHLKRSKKIFFYI